MRDNVQDVFNYLLYTSDPYMYLVKHKSRLWHFLFHFCMWYFCAQTSHLYADKNDN
jgi:hypothetical protein